MGPITSAADTNFSLMMDTKFSAVFVTAPGLSFLFMFYLDPLRPCGKTFAEEIEESNRDFFCQFLYFLVNFSCEASCHRGASILWLIKLQYEVSYQHIFAMLMHNIFIAFDYVFWMKRFVLFWALNSECAKSFKACPGRPLCVDNCSCCGCYCLGYTLSAAVWKC